MSFPKAFVGNLVVLNNDRSPNPAGRQTFGDDTYFYFAVIIVVVVKGRRSGLSKSVLNRKEFPYIRVARVYGNSCLEVLFVSVGGEHSSYFFGGPKK